MNTTGWLRGLEVTADGTGIVSHAGVALLRALADKSGLTAALSKALASRRLLVHDRGRVLADLACAIADGAEVISDFRVMADQGGLFGAVASGAHLLAGADEIARLRPMQWPPAPPQNLRRLALGTCDRNRLGPDHRPRPSPLTVTKPSQRPRKERQGPW